MLTADWERAVENAWVQFWVARIASGWSQVLQCVRLSERLASTLTNQNQCLARNSCPKVRGGGEVYVGHQRASRLGHQAQLRAQAIASLCVVSAGDIKADPQPTMLCGQYGEVLERGQLIAARVRANREASAQLALPTLCVPSVTGCISKCFELRRRAAHECGAAEDEPSRFASQKAPVSWHRLAPEFGGSKQTLVSIWPVSVRTAAAPA